MAADTVRPRKRPGCENSYARGKAVFSCEHPRGLRPGLAWRGSRGEEPLVALRRGRNSFSVGRIFGGELQNIPAGCFARGPLLQEKRGPGYVPDVVFLRFPDRGNRNQPVACFKNSRVFGLLPLGARVAFGNSCYFREQVDCFLRASHLFAGAPRPRFSAAASVGVQRLPLANNTPRQRD